MVKSILWATLICGAIDIVYAMTMGVLGGGSATGVLQSVASGPFGSVRHLGASGALLGLAVHFAIMAAMATVLAFAYRYNLTGSLPTWAVGIGYGLILYSVMHWIVLPLRWPAAFPQTAAGGVASALFAHVMLVGLPLAYLLRGLRPFGETAI